MQVRPRQAGVSSRESALSLEGHTTRTRTRRQTPLFERRTRAAGAKSYGRARRARKAVTRKARDLIWRGDPYPRTDSRVDLNLTRSRAPDPHPHRNHSSMTSRRRRAPLRRHSPGPVGPSPAPGEPCDGAWAGPDPAPPPLPATGTCHLRRQHFWGCHRASVRVRLGTHVSPICACSPLATSHHLHSRVAT